MHVLMVKTVHFNLLKHAEVITNQRAAFINYFKTFGCYLDILAVLPLEIFVLMWHLRGTADNAVDSLNYVALFKTNRLIKLWKVYLYMCIL